MLNKQKIIDKIGDSYKPMLDQISIPDFTKCIAQYSGIAIQYVSEEAIEDYLTKWCVNKKKFFDIMGEKVRVDFPFTFKDPETDYKKKFQEIGHEYPVFYPWIELVQYAKENKIKVDDMRYSNYSRLISDAFNGTVSAEGMAITRFFKQHLKASDELVTKIGGIFENREIEANFTISIDPVDIMLASENPYKWTSCYRLETNGFSDCHADGCLAAVIDSASLITYVWNNSGKFSLYDNYEFKDIRYKRMRMFIAMSNDFKVIHFNAIYPGRSNYPADFAKLLRDFVETFISEKIGCRNMWKQDYSKTGVWREYDYGYSEFSDHYAWIQSDCQDRYEIKVYDEPIICPCGCKNIVPGSYGVEDLRYNGDGMIYENFFEERYCEVTDEYTDCDGDCEHCSIWNSANAVCELDTNHYCEDRDMCDVEYEGDADFSANNIISCNPSRCRGCALFREHHEELFKDIIIKQISSDELELPTLYARSNGQWYINKNNEYYPIDDNRIDTHYDEEDLTDIVISLLQDEPVVNFEIYGQYENGLDLTRFLAKPEKNEELTTVSAIPTSWTSDVGTVTLRCNGFDNTISTELCTSPSIKTITSSGAEGIDVAEFHNMLDRIQDLETRLNTYNIPFEHTIINNAETDQHSDESEG